MQSGVILVCYVCDMTLVTSPPYTPDKKTDNQRMNFMLADSDVGFYINGLGSQFEMAKNFIGLTLWCQNCNGNADTREKTHGTGIL